MATRPENDDIQFSSVEEIASYCGSIDCGNFTSIVDVPSVRAAAANRWWRTPTPVAATAIRISAAFSKAFNAVRRATASVSTPGTVFDATTDATVDEVAGC